MSQVPGLENVTRFPLERRIEDDKPRVSNLQPAEILRLHNGILSSLTDEQIRDLTAMDPGPCVEIGRVEPPCDTEPTADAAENPVL